MSVLRYDDIPPTRRRSDELRVMCAWLKRLPYHGIQAPFLTSLLQRNCRSGEFRCKVHTGTRRWLTEVVEVGASSLVQPLLTRAALNELFGWGSSVTRGVEMLTWDWTHTNKIYYTEGTVIVPSSKVGLGKAVKDDTKKFWGVCTSKSSFWISKCIKQGGPMSSRSEFDGGAGAGITPASIAAQAAQLAAGRFIVKSNGNYQLDFHKKSRNLTISIAKQRAPIAGPACLIQPGLISSCPLQGDM